MRKNRAVQAAKTAAAAAGCVLVMAALLVKAVQADMAEHPEIANRAGIEVAVPVAVSHGAPEPAAVGIVIECRASAGWERAKAAAGDRIMQAVESACANNGVDERLVWAVIWVESRGDAAADNGQCVGVMQLNRAYESAFTAGTGVQNITDPANNVTAGVWWLGQIMAQEKDTAKALMVYNMGRSGAKALWQQGVTSTAYSDAVLEAMGC